MLLSSPVYKWRKWGTESFNDKTSKWQSQVHTSGTQSLLHLATLLHPNWWLSLQWHWLKCGIRHAGWISPSSKVLDSPCTSGQLHSITSLCGQSVLCCQQRAGDTGISQNGHIICSSSAGYPCHLNPLCTLPPCPLPSSDLYFKTTFFLFLGPSHVTPFVKPSLISPDRVSPHLYDLSDVSLPQSTSTPCSTVTLVPLPATFQRRVTTR